MIADLEAQLAAAVGDDRRPLRRKLRNLRRGAGVPMSRLRAGATTRAKKSASVRVLGESPEDAVKRLTEALRAAGVKPSRKDPGPTAMAYPVAYPHETLVTKFEALTGAPPTSFSFLGELVVLS